MGKVIVLTSLAILCCLGYTVALEPPRVIELTDGSIVLNGCAWSPDGTKIIGSAADGVYLIAATPGAKATRILDIPVQDIQWLSDSQLVGDVFDKQKDRQPRRMTRNYRFNLNGDFRVVYEGPVKPAPYITSSGAVWYDSADVMVRAESARSNMTTAMVEEYKLEIRPSLVKGESRAIPEKSALWLVSLDGKDQKHLVQGERFHYAKITGANDRIVGVTRNYEILVLDFAGDIIARIKKHDDRPNDGLYAWVSDPDLAPNNNHLLFARGYDDEKLQVVKGADIYLYDISAGFETQITNNPSGWHRAPLFNHNGRMALCLVDGKVLLIMF